MMDFLQGKNYMDILDTSHVDDGVLPVDNMSSTIDLSSLRYSGLTTTGSGIIASTIPSGMISTTSFPTQWATNYNNSVTIQGNLVLNGYDLNDRFKTIETILNIPHRDIGMEEKYEKLKNIAQEYNDTLAALKTWENIKESK